MTQAPDISEHILPEFEICAAENDVTLKPDDFGRYLVVYDVNEAFDKNEPADPDDGAWKGCGQIVTAAWGLTEAGAIHPDQINQWTGCAKKTLKQLRMWTFIRATGHHPPEGDVPGRKAS